MFTFLLVLQAIIGAALVTVILMQRSEGGGLGMGGSPSGLMSARGAADFLSRATAILAGIFVLLSIALATLAATRHATTIDTSLATSAPAPSATPPAGATVPQTDAAPFAGAAQNAAGATAPANGAAPADTGPVPLQQ
ncbi:preprotein translocase subunit SecG [Hephaestia sp. GCM10023244]|uniref:preprotein translocase subunit SecG n=1 Tax=unclassified Hephaestia TaxID=2631281 RepID=UPI0020773D4B|nr:preprotein translocase subunit SecG [Hephaestia sp. MAHUQ-44]MCM8730262.1 preprotein translocase subunit SecG [Hephaestia sp. MAHUQ-44]